MPKSVKLSLLATSVALVLAIFLGVNAHRVHAAGDPQDGAYRQINVYAEVLQHLGVHVDLPVGAILLVAGRVHAMGIRAQKNRQNQGHRSSQKGKFYTLRHRLGVNSITRYTATSVQALARWGLDDPHLKMILPSSFGWISSGL